MHTSIIFNSDSYKYSQWTHYPAGLEYVYSYIESRGGEWDSTLFFGLQSFLKEYFTTPITQGDINDADEFMHLHGEPFNKEGWQYILNKHGGYLPLVVKAVKEGSIVPTKNVLLSIENTDRNCAWLTSFVEPPVLRGIWFPTTVATNSYESKKIIFKWLKKTGDESTIDYKLVDFGSRGVSSKESSEIGGAAHLVNFKTTDNIVGILHARKYYNINMAGYSIPATEHSCITSWGKDNEVESYRNLIKQYKQVSIVSDSYDIYNACKIFGTILKDDIINNGTKLVVRPDSGVPHIVVSKCLQILDTHFGHYINNKGYKVLNNEVKVLQGDGITGKQIDIILKTITNLGYSADNLIFGQGGGLLQQLDRDTLKFAMKCSSIVVNGETREVYKDPITDVGKKSKRGRVSLYKNTNGEYYSAIENNTKSELITVFENGNLLKEYTFDEIRLMTSNKFTS